MSKLIHGFVPTHPGTVIKDEIEYLGISQRQLAEHLGMKCSVVNEILNGKRSVTTQTAFMIEAALGIPAEVLLHLQMKYDIRMAQADDALKNRLDHIERIELISA